MRVLLAALFWMFLVVSATTQSLAEDNPAKEAAPYVVTSFNLSEFDPTLISETGVAQAQLEFSLSVPGQYLSDIGTTALLFEIVQDFAKNITVVHVPTGEIIGAFGGIRNCGHDVTTSAGQEPVVEQWEIRVSSTVIVSGDQIVTQVTSGVLNRFDPPPLSWSAPIVRNRRIKYGNRTTQAGRDCHKATAG